MTSLGVMLLVASATTGFDGKAGVGGLHFFRHSAVAEGPPPPGGPIHAWRRMECPRRCPTRPSVPQRQAARSSSSAPVDPAAPAT